MIMKRKATAIWSGTGKEGKGLLHTTSGMLNSTPYSFTTRFVSEDGKAGTNPEELLAASHAGCFNMALSFQLTGAGFTPDELHTDAVVTMDTTGAHFKIARIDLNLTANVPGITDLQFLELAQSAKDNCPISNALSAVEINLEAKLKN